jgi:hypothetical protein
MLGGDGCRFQSTMWKARTILAHYDFFTRPMNQEYEQQKNR